MTATPTRARTTYRMTWQRRGWVHTSSKMFETEHAAFRLVSKLRSKGRPDLEPLESPSPLGSNTLQHGDRRRGQLAERAGHYSMPTR